MYGDREKSLISLLKTEEGVRVLNGMMLGYILRAIVLLVKVALASYFILVLFNGPLVGIVYLSYSQIFSGLIALRMIHETIS